MYRGEALYPGEALINGTYRLTFQTDGNLVLWNGSTFVWHLFDVQPGTPPGELVMQPDGNLVIYNAQGVYQWSALNQVGDGSYVWVQTDRNVCLYDSSNNPLWCTMTQGM
jgi:hypothetical protein